MNTRSRYKNIQSALNSDMLTIYFKCLWGKKREGETEKMAAPSVLDPRVAVKGHSRIPRKRIYINCAVLRKAQRNIREETIHLKVALRKRKMKGIKKTVKKWSTFKLLFNFHTENTFLSPLSVKFQRLIAEMR